LLFIKELVAISALFITKPNRKIHGEGGGKKQPFADGETVWTPW
jgi:hypothetical protein